MILPIKKKVTLLGSNWNNGSNASSFYWNLNNSVGNRNRNIGTHLCFIHTINIDSTAISYYTPPLGERKDNKELCW